MLCANPDGAEGTFLLNFELVQGIRAADDCNDPAVSAQVKLLI
jgi:hypothetical protein